MIGRNRSRYPRRCGMDHRLSVLCLSIVLFLTGCKSQTPAFLPITGGKEPFAPAQVEMARKNVVHYVISSSRLASMPQDADWQLDAQQASEKEYCFRSGDWMIVILQTDREDKTEQIIILNNAEKAVWTGYITPEGDVVDTYYTR